MAELQDGTPISAYGGYVVYSRPAAGCWGLFVRHAGAESPIPVPPCSQYPYDADVGPDADGGVSVVVSLCHRPPGVATDARPQQCAVAQHSLTGGKPLHLLGRPIFAQHASTFAPSIWGRRLAFARWARRGATGTDRAYARIWVADLRSSRKLKPLARGTTLGRHSCLGSNWRLAPDTYGWPSAIDLGPRRAAFVWNLRMPCDSPVQQLWSAGSRRQLVATGGGPAEAGGFRHLASPALDGADAVLFTSLSGEFGIDTGDVRRWLAPDNTIATSPPPPGQLILAVARDATGTYELRAPTPDDPDPAVVERDPCLRPGGCQLVHVSASRAAS